MNRFTGETELRLKMNFEHKETYYFDSVDMMIAFAIERKLVTASKIKGYSRRQRAKFVKDNAKLLHWGGKRFKPGYIQDDSNALDSYWDQRRRYRVFPKIGTKTSPIDTLLPQSYF